MGHARGDVGFQERTDRNDHPIYNYYRHQARLTNKRDKNGRYLPTCGAAVYTWHLEAGVRPRVKNPGTALSWSTSAKRSQRYELGDHASPQTVAKLRPGMVVSFRFRGQNHVGILEQVFPLYGVTDEANTSTSHSIGYYRSTRYGVICKIRFYSIMKEAIDWRDSPAVDSLVAINDRRNYITPQMDSIRAVRLSQPPPVKAKATKRKAKAKPKPKPATAKKAP